MKNISHQKYFLIKFYCPRNNQTRISLFAVAVTLKQNKTKQNKLRGPCPTHMFPDFFATPGFV
jgi:hypothetical protein